MNLSPEQSRAARGLLDWSQAELASQSNLSESTIRDFEKGRRVPSVNNLAAIRRALEAAGVEFTNGSQPGVKLRKTTVKRLTERERAETAKKYAREWTEYCKDTDSMAFAEANGDLVLIQYQRFGSSEPLNLFDLRVLEDGFELDGKVVDESEMQKFVLEALHSKPRFLGR